MTVGILEANLFFLYENNRQKGVSVFDEIKLNMLKYNVSFSDITAEMIFKAELSFLKYITTDYFLELCRTLMDFKDMQKVF